MRYRLSRSVCSWGVTVRQRPVAALKAERQADVHQLQQVEVSGRIPAVSAAAEKISRLPSFIVERYQQTLVAPDTAVAPGGGEYRLVYSGAERIASPEDTLPFNAEVLRSGLKGFEFLDDVRLQRRGIGVGRGIVQATEQVQQRRRRFPADSSLAAETVWCCPSVEPLPAGMAVSGAVAVLYPRARADDGAVASVIGVVPKGSS